MYLGWPIISVTPLLFIGLIPLFFTVDQLDASLTKFKGLYLILLIFIAHYTWLSLSLGWLNVTSPKTYQLAIIIESLSYSLVILPVFFIRKRIGENMGWLFMISAWVSLEFINQNWSLGTPYFVLGNGLGPYPQLIQFYELLGVEGGSLLLLLSNLGCYLLVKNIRERSKIKKSLIVLSIGVLPFLLSALHLFDYDSGTNKKVKVAAVHSFLETYADDSHKHPEKTVEQLWSLMGKRDLSNVELVLWPETVISNLGWITNIQGELAYKAMMDKKKFHPNFSICTGGYSYSLVQKNDEDPYIAHEVTRNIYYKAHNVALTLDTNGLINIRSKEIFIPFQERIPYLKQLPFLKNWVDFVGANTMVCYYENSKNVHQTMSGVNYVPVLCFESTYPYRMAQNAQEGALSVILANENWNKDLRGSDQYLFSNVGIAIQSRTSIARSSNSGISAMITPDGTIRQKRKGRNEGLIIADLPLKEDRTFYEIIAGLIYKMSLIITLGLIAWSFLNKLRGKLANI